MRRDQRATGTAYPCPARRLFTAWLTAAEGRLAIRPVVVSSGGGNLSFGFKGITDAIGGEMRLDDHGEVRLSVVAVPFGPVWDVLFHTAATPMPEPDGGLDPLFEPFVAWINGALARADSLAIWTRQADASDATAQPGGGAATAQRAKLLRVGESADAAIGAAWRAWKLLACVPVRLPGHGGWKG
jgi:hypothetical protein